MAILLEAFAKWIIQVLIHGEQKIQEQAANFLDASFEKRETACAGEAFRKPLMRDSFPSLKDDGNRWSSRCFPGYRSASEQHEDCGAFYERHVTSAQDEVYFPSDAEVEEDLNFQTPKMEKPQYAKWAQRTILAKNLSNRTTHKDIFNVIRGGIILDVYLRLHDRNASISFLEGAAAQDFMGYVKRNDIYIHDKRVRQAAAGLLTIWVVNLPLVQLEFSWSDRHFILPGHVANKINIGASRNLVIRNVLPRITEQRIRDDLDHIHNLAIVNIVFANGDAYLSLNSIHNSLFARTCMMSRATYKGMRIEWVPDECAQPLPKMPVFLKKEHVPVSKMKTSPSINRFQMLNMENEDGGSDKGSSLPEDEHLTITSEISSLKTSRRSPWGLPPTVVA